MKELITGWVSWFLTRFPTFWGMVRRTPCLNEWLNRFLINQIVNSTDPRPRPFSLWSPPKKINEVSPYTCWESLVNREFTSRHLPPASDVYIKSLPDINSVISLLYVRKDDIKADRSSSLFMFFAQWFTDSFLRTDPDDPRKNESNHEIDLCEIYGLRESTTDLLRSGNDGKLKSQIFNGEEYSPFLYNSDGTSVKDEFKGLPYIARLEDAISDFENKTGKKIDKSRLFASGLFQANSTAGYGAINTIFFREHNRICEVLKEEYNTWDDERLFQTTRNILTVILLKIVVEDYVNHISSNHFPFQVDIGFAEKQDWYQTNRVAIEFDLLYRWHSLVPDSVMVNGKPHPMVGLLFDHSLLLDSGLGKMVDGLSRDSASKIGLFNTPNFLIEAEINRYKISRYTKLKSYNDYRERYNLKRLKSFQELTSNVVAQDTLKDLYGNIDNVEFVAGLEAEEGGHRAFLGRLMTLMVGVDAFSQALTNPLLSSFVYKDETFSSKGMEIISETNSIKDVAVRNIKNPENLYISFDRPKSTG